MAGVLKITDGTNEVNFLDSSGLYLTEWYQKIAVKLANGDYADVDELVKLAWMQTTDDTRDAAIQTLFLLMEKADDFWRLRRLHEWVWLEARTHSETNSRYALLKNILPNQLDRRHWGPAGPVDLEPQLTREGLWRAVAPNGTPATISTSTIYNKKDSDGGNYFAFSATGDAPGLLIYELDPGTATPLPQNFIIAHKTAVTQAELDDFEPHLDVMLELDNAAKRVSDTNAPDDFRIDMTSTTTLRWTLTSAARKLSNYAGEYLIYGLFNVSGAGSATVQFRHGENYVSGPAVAPADVGSPATATYLGRTTIPGGVFNPSLTNPATYNLYLDVTITGTFTVQFFDLWLIPITKAPFVVRNAALSSGVLVVNGNLERTYEQTTGGVYQQTSTVAVETQGRYLQYEPGKYNGFYVFWTGNGDLVVPNWNMSVAVKLIPRFRALRGNV